MAYTRYVTAGANASDVNGGGQQLAANDGPIVTRTNCTSDGAGTTITNNGGDGWGSAALNDGICFDTAGAKNYSRIAAINGNGLTVSPAVGISQSGKAVNVGGAFATLARSCAVALAGEEHRWCGNWTITAGLTQANAGTAAAPIVFTGYAADKSDYALSTVTLTSGTNTIITGNNWTRWECISAVMSASTSTGQNWSMSTNCRAVTIARCHTSCTGANKRIGYNISAGAGAVVEFLNDLASSCTTGFVLRGAFTMRGCRATTCSVAGVGTVNATATGDITDCLIDGNTGDGINWGYSTTTDLLVLNNNTIVGNSGDGVDLLAGSCYLFGNNVIAQNGAYGITADAGCVIPGYGNLIPSSGADTNTAGALHNVTLAVPSGLPASLTGSQICDFLNVGASDYRLGKNSAGREYGWPGTMPGLTALVSTGVTDAGAVQRAEPSLPAVGNVKSGVTYGDYGTELTGTYVGGAGGGASVIGSSVISPLREVA